MKISGGTVVTGDGASVIPDGYVQVRDSRIVEIGAGGGPPDDDVIDASGQIVIPGIINTHAHGCVEGPFVPVGSPAFSGTAVHAELDRHLFGGETTVLCVCGFCLPREIDTSHPVRTRLATSHTPSNFAAADLVDGKGLLPPHRAMTVEQALKDGAVAIGEIGAGHSLGGGAQDYLYIPDVIEKATGVRLRPDQARQLKWAILGRMLSRDAFDAARTERCLDTLGLSDRLDVTTARRLIDQSVLPSIATTLEGFEEAAALSAKTGVRAVFHTSPVSVGVIERLAKKYPAAKLVAGHANQSDFEPQEAVDWAKRLRTLGVTIDISTWDIPGKAIQAKPDNFLAMLKAGVVDTVSTDYAGGDWEPILKGLALAIKAEAVGLAAAVALATANPARLFPGLAPDRGVLAAGKIADVVLVDANNVGSVRTVIIGGKVLVRDKAAAGGRLN
ncbi:Cytosine/adenosine deaminase [Bradyrhizobium lablabi]|uniref:Cytosine/adenosine deaminase n=2 Tax=Bradyrhizobium lablabi TaxID=722472 RepID=A0A1M7AFC3_9BRAD|nr:Cytosine/adenosine deaminase [Bradyrhizobium lablabi]